MSVAPAINAPGDAMSAPPLFDVEDLLGRASEAPPAEADGALARARRGFASLADTAAGLFETLPFRARGQRRWVVRPKDDGVELLCATVGDPTPVAWVASAGAMAEAPWRRELDAARAVELRLDPDTILRRRISLPAESRPFLRPIVEHRLDRLTPWSASNVVFGFRVAEEDAEAGTVTLDFAATSRTLLRETLTRMATLGIAPSAVGSDADPPGEPLLVDILSGRGDQAGARARQRRRRILSIALLISAVLYLASAALAFVAQGEADAAEAELAAQRRAVAARGTLDAGTTDALEALIASKASDGALFQLVDTLAAAIPDGTFLTDLEIAPGTLRLRGRSADAPALIPLLEGQGRLSAVRFEAPVLREPDGGDRFDIVATRDAPPPAPGSP